MFAILWELVQGEDWTLHAQTYYRIEYQFPAAVKAIADYIQKYGIHSSSKSRV